MPRSVPAADAAVKFARVGQLEFGGIGVKRGWRALLAILGMSLAAAVVPSPSNAASATCPGGILLSGHAFMFDQYAGTCTAGAGSAHLGFNGYYSYVGAQFNRFTVSGPKSQSPSPVANCKQQAAGDIDPYVSNGGRAVCSDAISYTDPYGNPVAWTLVSIDTDAAAFAVSFTPIAAPTIAGLSVSVGPVAGGSSLTISGANLYAGNAGSYFGTVTIGGVGATITANTTTSLTVTTPAHAGGTVDVVVTLPNGAVTQAGAFTYTRSDQAALFPSYAPSPVVYGATAGLGLAGGSGTGAVSHAVTAGASFCSIQGSTLTAIGVGTCTVASTKAGDATYNPATASYDITVEKAGQTVSFTNPGSKPASAAPFALTASATSGLPVSFASTTASVCTVAGATVTLVGSGTCSITATQAGNTSYAAATPVIQAFGVDVASQTISFTRPADRPLVSGGTVPLSATATSGLAVSFASNSTAVCTVAGSTATMIAAGQCSITASQGGNASYAAATPVTQAFALTQATTSTTLTSSANPIFLNQAFTLTAAVTANETSSPTRQAAPMRAAPAPATPTGTVTFAMGGTVLCGSVPLSGGVAMCNTAISTPGSQNIVAAYSGGGGFGVSTSNIVAQTVVDQRARTAQVVGRFMGQRTNLLASNEPDGGRQIDRLMEAGGQGGTQGAGLADDAQDDRSMRAATSSRLGAGPDGGDIGRMRLGGARTDRPLQDSIGGNPRDDNPFPADTSTGRTIDAQTSSGGSLTAGPMRFSGSTDGAARFGFSTSLRDIARYAAQAEADKSGVAELGLGGRTSGIGGKARPNPFDIWAEGKYSDFRDDRRNRDLDGHFGLFSAGADYVVRPHLLVGALVQFDSMRQTSAKDVSTVRGDGWMAGPYATLRLSPNVFWQMRAAWGRSSNEVSPYQTYTDSFSSQRWLASTTLAGRWGIGPWTLKPSLSVTYLEDTAESFTETHGTIIPEVKSRLGQAKVGPEISYRYHLHDGMILEPRAGMQLIWNFAGDTAIAGQGQLDGENAGPEGGRGRAEIGLRASAIGGFGIDLSGSYDGIGVSGYSAVTGRAAVRVPLN